MNIGHLLLNVFHTLVLISLIERKALQTIILKTLNKPK